MTTYRVTYVKDGQRKTATVEVHDGPLRLTSPMMQVTDKVIVGRGAERIVEVSRTQKAG